MMGKKKDEYCKRSTHVEAKPTPEQVRQRYLRHRRFVHIGQVIMLVGFLIAFQHWLAHLGLFGPQPPLWLDTAAGYPMGALILAIGAIVAGRKAT